MNITVNGKNREISESITLRELVKSTFKDYSGVIVLYNDSICKTREQTTITIKANDRIEFVQLIGGG